MEIQGPCPSAVSAPRPLAFPEAPGQRGRGGPGVMVAAPPKQLLAVLLATVLLPCARAQAQAPRKPSGILVILIACGSLAIVFIAALLLIRCLEFAHRKITGKREDKFE
eukprot:s559_g13.t1